MKTKAIKIATGVLAVIAVGFLLLYVPPLLYLYCLSRDGSWQKATTESDMDSRLLAFYTKSLITPRESSWGRSHVLASGQRMTRYMIFSKEPLDVVYNGDGSVDAIYTSYE